MPALLKNVPLDVVLPNLSPITPSLAGLQTVSADLPPAWDYLQLDLEVQNVTLAMMQEIRIMANGTPIYRLSGTELDTWNQFFKAPAFVANGTLSVFFRRLGIRSGSAFGNDGGIVGSAYAKDLAYETSLNCGAFDKSGNGVRSLRVEIDLVGTAAGAASIQVLGRALPIDQTRGGAGLVPRMEKQAPNVAAGAQYVAAKNNLLFGDPLHAILFGLMLVPASGTLDLFTLRFNGFQWIQRSDARNRFIQSQDDLRLPQAGYYNIDISERGYGDEVLPILDPGTDLQLQFTPSAAGAVTIIQHTAGFLG